MRFRSSIITSAIILFLALFSFGGATLSWFTSEATLDKNTFTVSSELQPSLYFNDLSGGAYVIIRNSGGEEILFQKIGENRALLRGTIGTDNQNNANSAGDNYYQNFDSALVEDSALLDKAEAAALQELHQETILALGEEWWLSTRSSGNRRDYVDNAGQVVYGKQDKRGIRPSLFLQEGLRVTGGDGTAENPYYLLLPD